MNKILFWFLVIVFVITISFNTISYIADYYINLTHSKQYPLLKDRTPTYHLTSQYVHTIMKGNKLNPFYCPYELWKSDNNEIPINKQNIPKEERELLLAYGPSNPNKMRKKLRVMIVCGQHGREMISGEICYHLIKLIQLQERDPDFTKRLAKLIELGVGFWILPLANPWARLQIETDPNNACLRKNKNGVDLNRNFERAPRDIIRSWDRHHNKVITEDDEEYPGIEPMSEHESQSTKTLLEVAEPHLLINVHSGTSDILLPYDYTTSELPPHYNNMVRLAKLSRKSVCPKCKIGQSSLLLYDSHGTLMDYAITRMGVPLAYTLEIFESEDVDNTLSAENLKPEQCIKWFNPEKGKQTTEVILKWLDFIITITEKTMVRFNKLGLQ